MYVLLYIFICFYNDNYTNQLLINVLQCWYIIKLVRNGQGLIYNVC